jgi:protein-tyrosine phosphatase
VPPKPTKLAVANPFYDNIRQNLELSSGIAERILLVVPRRIIKRATELPFEWLRDIVRKAGATGADGVVGGEALEDLAMQFYRIELGEQRRMNGVMNHHSNESVTPVGPAGEGVEPQSTFFPYSITAGVEKGAKNR